MTSQLRVLDRRPTTSHSPLPVHPRRGVAIFGAVATLSVLAVFISAIAWQILANRRMLEHRRDELQAMWLARAGVERAAARLLTDARGYEGEVLELIPQSSVRIEVKLEPGSPDTFRVRCEASYPNDADDLVVRSLTRFFRRHVEGDRRRLEPVPDWRATE